MHFATALEHTVNVVVYGEFEAVLEIDKGRNIIYNYWLRPTIYHDFWLGTRWYVPTKWSLKTLYPKSSLRTRPLSCETHTTATNQGNIASPCTWTRSVTTSIRTEKSRNTPSSRTLWTNIARSGRPTIIFYISISTVCGQYCVAFLMFRCLNMSMHAFARLFTSDLIVNDCRVFDWLGALNKTLWKTSVFVSYVNYVNNGYW